ncbi:MAG: hypothetical protein OEQ39_26550 [Gammaproteobacteria bacterium]|nr:hypothetical protein [Gammaproteobacteria bacterium]
MEKILRSWANARGWRTKRRLVIFESDDWGAIRMRDPSALREMQRRGVCLDSSPYDRLDSLENRADLEMLFDLLEGYRDQTNNRPIFTFNTVMGNPDFEAIRAGDFAEYSRESLWESYRRYRGQDLQQVWNNAISESLIRPQFHGREHLNIRVWMEDLRNNYAETRIAFDQDYYGIKRPSTSGQRKYLAANWPVSPEHLEEIQEIVVDGMVKFEEVFGFPSKTFIPCNYVLPRDLESTLKNNGIELIQGTRGQLEPTATGKVSIRRSFTGQRNALGQWYSIRNVMFEPFEDQSKDWVASALAEIGESFFWRKPAIVQTHRVNYVSGMDVGHRDRSLRLLHRLLKSILDTWPDVEFMSSDQLLEALKSQRLDSEQLDR